MDEMRLFHVSSTPDASADVLRHFLYINLHLRNPEAADSYLMDYDDTVEMLSKSAGSLRIGEAPIMKERSLRRINFLRHDYFLVYRVNGNEAEIIAVGHSDEDLNNVIR